MSGENPQDGFNRDRAELFEALGHPTRIKILQVLSESPLGFSELKKETGIESNGLLSFHLVKLQNLIKTTSEGSYTLTDEGREAIRIIPSIGEIIKQRQLDQSHATINRTSSRKAIIIGMLLVLLIAIPITAYLYITNVSLLSQNDQLKNSVFIQVGNIFSSTSSDLQTCITFYDWSDYSQSSLWLDVALSHLQDMPISMSTLGSDYDRLNITSLNIIEQQLQQIRNNIPSGRLTYNQIEYLKNCYFTFHYLYDSMQQPQNNIYRISDIGNVTNAISALAQEENLKNSSAPIVAVSYQFCGCALGCICSIPISINGTTVTEPLPQTFDLTFISNGEVPYTQSSTFFASLSTCHEVNIVVNSSAPIYFDESSSLEGLIINQTQITYYNAQIIPGKDLPTSSGNDQFTFDFEPANSNATVYFDVTYIF